VAARLQHQHAALKRSLTAQQRAEFCCHCERSKPPRIDNGDPRPVFSQPTPPRGVRDKDGLNMEINMNVLEATAIPQIGDSAFYRPASPQARKLLVTVTGIFANGRIRVEFPDGTWKSLARDYHKRVQNERYGLVRIE
jgi:hypothetical protein